MPRCIRATLQLSARRSLFAAATPDYRSRSEETRWPDNNQKIHGDIHASLDSIHTCECLHCRSSTRSTGDQCACGLHRRAENVPVQPGCPDSLLRHGKIQKETTVC